MGAEPEFVKAGRVSSAHGLDGSVKVASPVPALLSKGAVVTVAGEERTIERRSGTDAKPIIRLSGSSNRDDADRLRGADLMVPRSEVAPLGEDEWWASDLVGCEVKDGAASVGVIKGVIGLPSCEALEVEREVGSTLLVPMVGDALRSVDVEARCVDVDLKFLGES